MYVRALPADVRAETLARGLAGLPGFAWLDADHTGRCGADGRRSFVTACPAEWRRVPLGASDPLAVLDALALPDAPRPPPAGPDRPPLPAAGDVPHWIGYVAYDAFRAGSRRPPRHARGEAAEGVVFARYPAVFAVDHRHRRSFVVGDDRTACERLLDLWRSGTSTSSRACALGAAAGALRVPPASEHTRAIGRALELIARGDLYQVNLARRFEAPFQGDPLALALAMRRASPVPLGFYFEDGQRTVIGRSMERFLRWTLPSRRLLSRPIKGTIARLGDDAGERNQLRSDPKEHAEHAMIVDLVRNDLGRVAEIGSVEVAERMLVEPFAGLHHLVSTIACHTRAEVGRAEILRATFPPGSVTGAPKLRAIETIDALEPAARGIYTGALGHVDRSGGLSLAVAIRTAVVERDAVVYHAGGGIVEASRPERELAETELKARVFTEALRALATPDSRAARVAES
jgi:anthranilate/para-aminobenzoate synthase component I